MTVKTPVLVRSSDAAVDDVIDRVGNNIVLGLPLGLEKPLRFANALYQRAVKDPALRLHIVTGLSLQIPQGKSSLERRFLEPFTQRLSGAIPELEYARDAAGGKLPKNVRVCEFFFQAGNFLHRSEQQRHYVCSNDTHAVRDLMAQGINVIAQMVAPGPNWIARTRRMRTADRFLCQHLAARWRNPAGGYWFAGHGAGAQHDIAAHTKCSMAAGI